MADDRRGFSCRDANERDAHGTFQRRQFNTGRAATQCRVQGSELEPTRAEWEQAIAFLTRTGQMCSDKRQEFILLSDTLGVSMLVDAINHRRDGGGTESTVLGPFYRAGAQRLP